MSRRDNAFKHNVKPALVTGIIRDFKRDPSFIDRKIQKEADELATVDKIKSEYDAARALCRSPLSSR